MRALHRSNKLAHPRMELDQPKDESSNLRGLARPGAVSLFHVSSLPFVHPSSSIDDTIATHFSSSHAVCGKCLYIQIHSVAILAMILTDGRRSFLWTCQTSVILRAESGEISGAGHCIAG